MLPCWWCRYKNPEGFPQGLDRLDCDGPYSEDNTVPSCGVCNLKRGAMGPEIFSLHVLDMARTLEVSLIFTLPVEREYVGTGTFGVSKAAQPAERKRDELTAVQRKELESQNCYMCGETGGGVDRVENSKHYTLENSKPACWPCNRIKHDWPLDRLKQWLACVAFVARKRLDEGDSDIEDPNTNPDAVCDDTGKGHSDVEGVISDQTDSREAGSVANDHLESTRPTDGRVVWMLGGSRGGGESELPGQRVATSLAASSKCNSPPPRHEGDRARNMKRRKPTQWVLLDPVLVYNTVGDIVAKFAS
ncbi:hypothetical protein HDU93_006571, partial [Gonapodya sp. JEL0774]